MFAAFSPGSDFKRYYRGRMPRLALAVILIMPLMYGALYLWAFWNPFGNVDKVPVALVNLDAGAEMAGESVDAGTDVVSGLIESKQLDLHEVSEEEGATGLSHGDYGWTITIPENFSESIVSAATGDPHQAQLVFTYDETNNYLNTVIGQDAAEEVIVQVSSQVSQQVFEAVVTGIEGEIPKILAAGEGVDELNAGMQQANTGAQELATNLVTAKNGSEQISAAIDEIVAAADRLIGDAEQFVEGSGLTGDEIRAAAQQITDGADRASGLLNDIQAVHDQAADDLRAVVNGLNDAGLADLAGDVQRVIDNIENTPAVADANRAFEDVRAAAAVISGELDNPNSHVNVALRFVEDGNVVNEMTTVQSKAGELRAGADQLSSGLDQLSAGATQLAEGTPKLADGTAELADGVNAALKMIPHWDGDQTGNFVKTLAQPVVLDEVTKNPAKTFAYGFAPFFFGLALFVGSIIAWMLFTPLQARPLASGLGSFRTVLASYAPTLAIGILQSIILFLVTYLGLGLKPQYAVGTALFMCLMTAMFLAMIQMFNAVLGPAVGRVTTLAFLMIMLTSAGGIYPVQTTSLPFQWFHPYDPMTYTVNGLRQLIMGGIDHRLGIAIAVIIGLTAAFLAVSTWAARRNRQYNMDRLYPPVEV